MFHSLFLSSAQYIITFQANTTLLTMIDPHLFHPECKVFDFKCGSFCSANSLESQAEYLTDVKHLVFEVQQSNLESHYRPSTGGGHRATTWLGFSYPSYKGTVILPVLENSLFIPP